MQPYLVGGVARAFRNTLLDDIVVLAGQNTRLQRRPDRRPETVLLEERLVVDFELLAVCILRFSISANIATKGSGKRGVRSMEYWGCSAVGPMRLSLAATP